MVEGTLVSPLGGGAGLRLPVSWLAFFDATKADSEHAAFLSNLRKVIDLLIRGKSVSVVLCFWRTLL